MRLSKRPNSGLQMNMTPMIDVVFLTLIFFMTVSQVSAVNKERLELPKQAGSQDQVESPITINVDEQGQILVSGNRVTLAQLVAQVNDEIIKAGNDPSQLTIALRADRRGTCRTVNEVVTALSELAVDRVRIAVENAP
jgi:biopolymer transport protein ExbD